MLMRKIFLIAGLVFIILSLNAFAISEARQTAIRNSMIFNAINAYNATYDNATGIVGSPAGALNFEGAANATHYAGGNVEFNSVHTDEMLNFTAIIYTNSTYSEITDQRLFADKGAGGVAAAFLAGIDTRATPESCDVVSCLQFQYRDSGNSVHVNRAQVASWFTNLSYKIVAVSLNITNSASAFSMAVYYNTNLIKITNEAAGVTKASNNLNLMDRTSADLHMKGSLRVGMILNMTVNSDDLEYILEQFQAGNYNLSAAAAPPEPGGAPGESINILRRGHVVGGVEIIKVTG